MTATKVTSDRFKVPGLLARRLGEHKLNETAVGLYGKARSFFRAFHEWEGTSPGEWRTRHRTADTKVAAH